MHNFPCGSGGAAQGVSAPRRYPGGVLQKFPSNSERNWFVLRFPTRMLFPGGANAWSPRIQPTGRLNETVRLDDGGSLLLPPLLFATSVYHLLWSLAHHRRRSEQCGDLLCAWRRKRIPAKADEMLMHIDAYYSKCTSSHQHQGWSVIILCAPDIWALQNCLKMLSMVFIHSFQLHQIHYTHSAPSTSAGCAALGPRLSHRVHSVGRRGVVGWLEDLCKPKILVLMDRRYIIFHQPKKQDRILSTDVSFFNMI